MISANLQRKNEIKANTVSTPTVASDSETYNTIKTVLTTTLWKPPPRTGSLITGSVSLTIMLASSRVTSSKCPFFLMGLILFAYSFCFL